MQKGSQIKTFCHNPINSCKVGEISADKHSRGLFHLLSGSVADALVGHPWAAFLCVLDMTYLHNRTFAAPQGADCSEGQTESWDPWCSFPLCFLSLRMQPSTLSPQTAPTLPLAERPFQLQFGAEVRLWRIHVMSSLTLPLKLCVGAAETLLTLCNEKVRGFSFVKKG